ncbi:indolepyruvate oxidoreductase subunit beta [Sulfolobus islandicus]|uniref:Pyruvate ferredoxin/flavodoxin oxidoreductase n=1 Tax=Saccharolobus islandicus (strain HVE10/4) TaxID=930943 RepID=F0NJN5_SACI0|nr:indolepyruvate oxidoreductase subunit beta [Sulfolobus islandicus]ADX81972.1 pyruvate ferredoxin/flavodoxin oxidoreductase [Sulfolobus islandicus HVE10/4]WCM36685.1 indolepyruvate oxidoreductase subunit beta [Sulfolobus islandicus]
MARVNILIAGVGGQGIITAGKIIAEAGNYSNTKVLIAETHGLAQRGGGVNIHVRIGDVNSPLIPLGKADYLVGLEATEVLRNLNYASRKHTTIIINNYVVRPVLPKVRLLSLQEILDKLKGCKVYVIDANQIAINAGNIKAANAAILGFLYSLGAFEGLINEESFIKALKYESNIKAFKIAQVIKINGIDINGI